jgi:26S proteasome regulatory subunit N5
MAEGQSGSASGGQLAEKVDWSAEVDEKIPQAETLAQAGQLAEALALLAGVEKKCRLGNDNPSLVRVCKASLELCYKAKDVDALISSLETLSTRRSQKTAAIRALVETALPWCVNAPYEPIAVANDIEKANRDKLVTCLRDITDGKIALEKERAQLTRAFSKIKVRPTVHGHAVHHLFECPFAESCDSH